MVYVTSPASQASVIVQHLLDHKLIACANIIAAQSMYKWQGNNVQEEEVIIIAKTAIPLWERLQKEISKIHPYTVPCILSFPIQATAAYTEFVNHEVII